MTEGTSPPKVKQSTEECQPHGLCGAWIFEPVLSGLLLYGKPCCLPPRAAP